MTNEHAEPFPNAASQDDTQTPPRIWPAIVAPIVAVALAVALQAAVAALLLAILLARGVEPSALRDRLTEEIMSPGAFLLMLIGGQVAFASVALLAAYMSPEPMRQRLGFNPVRESNKVYGLTTIGSILPLVVALAAVSLVARVIPHDPTFEAVFAKMTPLWGIVFVVLIAFAPGFIEEMLFRGYVQQRLLKRCSPLGAIGVTSVLFALAHVTPHGITVALPLGIWFGVIAWRTRSIGPSIACHAFVNGGLNAWRLVVKFGGLSETTQTTCHVIFVLLGTSCFVLACRLLASDTFHPGDRQGTIHDGRTGIDAT